MSNLSAFIREHIEQILLEWEAFARAMPLGELMPLATLRDHAQTMLEVIASDLETPQTAREQSDKARGLASFDQRLSTAAAKHGSGRAASGFTVVQMVAEFRALRASVIRLWTAHQRQFGAAEFDDLIRFNEAIDQAVAESLTRYSTEISETRERFLAILGHDLRNPLSAIATSAKFLLENDVSPADRATLIRGIDNSAQRMNRLVSDLLDLALSRLGDTMPITRASADIGSIIRDVATEVGASYPSARIEAHSSGDLKGAWDSPRLTQALTNLVGNAVQHGDTSVPITVDARGDRSAVVIDVHNAGPAIPSERMGSIFDDMKGGTRGGDDGGHLGLGLFIVAKIVDAHGGTIDVRSTDESGTTFTVRLPKQESADAT
jgi:signal transduction histidine kinase